MRLDFIQQMECVEVLQFLNRLRAVYGFNEATSDEQNAYKSELYSEKTYYIILSLMDNDLGPQSSGGGTLLG